MQISRKFRVVFYIVVLVPLLAAACSEPNTPKTPAAAPARTITPGTAADAGTSPAAPTGTAVSPAAPTGAAVSPVASPVAGGTSGSGSIKLNPPLPRDGDIIEPVAITPDGKRIVYIADQTTNDVYELYSVGSSGGPSVKLNAPLPQQARVYSFTISPDGSLAVYVVRTAREFDSEIAVAPVAGGTPVRLTPALDDFATIAMYSISPDSSRVVYLAQHKGAEYPQLYSVPAGGGAAVQLSLPASGETGSYIDADFLITSGGRVIYRESGMLYSVPLAGGAKPIQLTTLKNIHNFKLSPDQRTIVFRAQSTREDVYTDLLYSIPASGGTATLISGELSGAGVDDNSRGEHSFSISPDNRTVVFTARGEDNRFELYSAAIGSANTAKKLNPPMQPDANIGAFLISPDSRTVVYQADAEQDDFTNIYSVPTGGGTAVRLNFPLDPNGTRSVSKFDFSPDSARIIYIAYVSLQPNLYSVPVAGPSNAGIQLNTSRPYETFHQAVDFKISPDSKTVVYREQAQRPPSPSYVYYVLPPWIMSVPLTGGKPTALPGSAPSVSGFWYTPDGSRVVYISSKDSSASNRDEYNLYITAVVPR